MRTLSLLLCLLLVSTSVAEESTIRLATFDVDATPPVGSEMAYDTVKRHDELTLRCRGVVLMGLEQPIVMCAIDWLGVGNDGHKAFRQSLADAAGTSVERVAMHALHQHDAPVCDFSAERIIRETGSNDYGRYDGSFQRIVIQRAAEALRAGIEHAQPVTHYGWGSAEVKRVASNRRIMGDDGRVRAVRYTTERNPAMRAEPEGVIDPEVSIVSFWNGETPLAALSYYACHPQSYYRTGVPSSDFPGIARFIRGQAVPEALHVHFAGAGGNIGAGKYNDGNKENRMLLANRLADGMKMAWNTTKKTTVTSDSVGWQSVAVQLPAAKHLVKEDLFEMLKSNPSTGPFRSGADRLAWLLRCDAGDSIDVTCLRIGDVRLLHLPGELFVEYQLAAKAMRPDLHVAMAAYGDYGPWYIGTEVAYGQGGYETSERASNVAPGVERILMNAMEQLLDVSR